MTRSLSIEKLSVEFDAPFGGRLPALGPVTIDIQSGQFVTLVGPSGCGKSTLIRVLAGLQTPTNGEARLDNQPILKPSPRIGLMFQQANLMPWRSVMDNIALPLELAGQEKSQRYRKVHQFIPSLGLEGFEKALPGELSGGMAQRAALGRLLVQNPDVLLLDEPFGALDAMTRERLSGDLLKIWAEHQQTVLMVTHDINEAIYLSDRVLVMSSRPGRVIEDVTIELPRPRHVEQVYDPQFAKYARQIRDAIDRA